MSVTLVYFVHKYVVLKKKKKKIFLHIHTHITLHIKQPITKDS